MKALLIIFLLLITACQTPTREYTPLTTIVNLTPSVNVTNETNVSFSFPHYLIPVYGELSIYTFYFSGGSSSQFIIFPDNKTMLVNANENDLYRLSGFIKDLGFADVDFLLFTSDRPLYTSGAEKAILKFYPEKVFYNGISIPSSYSIFTNLTKIPYDSSYILGNVIIDFFIPYDDGFGFVDGENDMMVRFRYQFASVLLGTCTNNCENRLKDSILTSDVFIMSHGCGNSFYFLREIKPTKTIHYTDICEKEKTIFSQLNTDLISTDLAIQLSTDGARFNVTKYRFT